ncbi:MAG TPA: YcxB family protein [Gemmataceae bacterium]|nr:YcxB family protein [Gemmataceae bacterium]
MQVEFRLTPDDLTALRRFHQKHPPIPTQRKFDPTRLIISATLAVAVFAFVFVRAILDDPLFDTLFALFPGVGAGAILTLIGLTLYAKLTAPNRMRRALEQGRNSQKVLGWRRISIDEQALHVDTEYSSLIYLWWAIDAVTASEDHAFIYFMTNNAFIVPREAFRTDREFEEFLEAARRYHRMAEVSAEPPRLMAASRPPKVEPPPLPGEAPADDRIIAPGRLSEKRETNP